MSTAAPPRPPAASGRPRREPLPRRAAPTGRRLPARGPADVPLALRLAAFSALALFVTAHWSRMLADAPLGRVILVVAIATLGGAVLAGTGSLTPGWRRPATLALRIAVVLLTTGGGLLAAGLPRVNLWPGRWDDLWAVLDRSVSTLYRTDWPYAGTEPWVALTLLLAVPVVVVSAAVLAFLPLRRGAALARAAALVLLVGLYAVAATENPLGSELVRGLVLFALIAAWLWLPRLGARDARATGVALALAGLLALPLAGAVSERTPWFDYESWSIWEGGATASFSWTHSYGPIDWPRDGTTLLYVRSSRPHYWKVEGLERFDGLRWYHSEQDDARDVRSDLPAPNVTSGSYRRWVQTFRFTLAGLRSDLLVGAGSTLEVDAVEDRRLFAVGPQSIRAVGPPLEKGESYVTTSYLPEPPARELRLAPASSDPDPLRQATTFDLPGEGEDAFIDRQPPVRDEPFRDRALRARFPLRGELATPGEEGRVARRKQAAAERKVRASPYGGVYRLARSLGAGDQTTFDVVRRVQGYLRDTGRFSYSEDPPERRYPLAAFIDRDRIGYCQQFSGAMALMLRMNGVPARVAAGFSPGSFNRDTNEFRVRDLDAHSWVEVWFEGHGWVPFDPTPPLSPARSQTGDAGGAPSSSGPNEGGGGPNATQNPFSGQREPDAAAAAVEESGGGGLAWRVPAAVIGGVALILLGLWGRATLLRRRLPRERLPEAELAELERALQRLGYPMPAGTTLLGLERRLGSVAGAGAALYVRRLRERRYGAGRAPGPTRAERRALRTGLARGAGRLGRLRGLLALPPAALTTPARARHR